MTGQRGFSLAELVMVMVVIGILAAVATPRLTNLSSYSLTGAAQDLVEAVRYAQQQSMSNSGAINFSVNVTTSGFTVLQGGATVTNPLTGSGYTQDSKLWSGVSITAGTGTITFDSRGRPAGNNNVTITLQSNSETKSVIIERYTGYAHTN